MTDLPDQPMSGQPQHPARQRSAAWIVVLIAAGLTLLLIAITQNWFGGAAESNPSPSLAASAQAGGSESPGASGAGRPSIGSGLGVNWTTVATLPGASASDVTAGGPGWVAVGASGAVGCEICPGIETYAGKIWSSADGETWEEVAVPGLEATTLSAVASGPAGLVAIGWHLMDPSAEQQAMDHHVLVSANGESWMRVDPPPFAAFGTVVYDVIGGPMFVATGSVAESDQYSHAAIWTSINGRDWEEAYRSPEVGWITQVVSGGDGWVAAGTVGRPVSGSPHSLPTFPVLWESADGVTWTQRDLPLPATAAGGSAEAILNAAPGLVVVGNAEYGPFEPPGPVNGFAAWRSGDGVTWEAAPVTPDFLENIGGGHLLYESADRVFAIGSGCRCGTGWPGRWWTTPDGLAWTEHQETPPILYAVIPFDGGLLAVGIEKGEGAIFISE